MSVPLFPKIPAYRRGSDVLHQVRRVFCMEKLDGSNTRVFVPRDGPAVFGGRTLLEGEPGFCQPELRQAFDPQSLELARELRQDLLLYGETCGRGIQAQGFLYGHRPRFVLFGAQLDGVWLSLTSLRELAAKLHLVMAPVLYEGPPDESVFDALREQPSTHARSAGRADAPQEGIVIWSDPFLLDGAGQPLVAKHKDPRRGEVRDREEVGPESADAFAERVVPLERLRHARQHLQETGRPLQLELLQQRVIQDVSREVPEYQEQLRIHGKAAVREALAQRVAQLLAAVPTSGDW